MDGDPGQAAAPRSEEIRESSALCLIATSVSVHPLCCSRCAVYRPPLIRKNKWVVCSVESASYEGFHPLELGLSITLSSSQKGINNEQMLYRSLLMVEPTSGPCHKCEQHHEISTHLPLCVLNEGWRKLFESPGNLVTDPHTHHTSQSFIDSCVIQ